jgi:hypothetical protein
VRRSFLSCATVAVFAFPCPAAEPATTPETLIRLTVQPAPAPRPALRYLLLPELNELNPGNPCHNYLKCFMEQQKFFFDKEAFQRRQKLLVMPLRELPARELQDYGSFALRQADWAARLDKPDWQILMKLKTDGISLLLPDLQEMRQLASALKVRFRAEVALGRFDDALRTAKTLFAMTRHLGEHPTLIGDLVGIAVASVALGPLEEMLEQPGCPNLYWALTNLPKPLVALDKGAEGERASIAGEFRDLDETAPMSKEQLVRFIAHMDHILSDGKPIKPGDGVRGFLNARTKDEGKLSAARRRLVDNGLPEERVLRFPADQVILLDEKREFEVRRDDIFKLMNLPTWQIEAIAAKTRPFGLVPNSESARPAREPALFADAFVPALYRVHQVQGRLEQRLALLRHVEALRMYAAEHDGNLPAKLSEISLPLPDDPVTGKPFHYERVGSTVHLRGTPPLGREKEAVFNLHYEVTLQKSDIGNQRSVRK